MKKNSSNVAKRVIAISLSILMVGTVPAFALEKKETVYGILNSNGSQAKVIVSDFIHSDEKIDKLTINSNLEALTDLQKSDTPEINGEQVSFNVNGYELNYQGISPENLPVDTKVMYFLDGVEVSADALTGKSGQLKMIIHQTNNQFEEMMISGKSQKLYVPYYSLTTMRLSSEVFANVNINQGKVISDGKNFIVTGLLAPGMKENFEGVLDLNIEDELIITAEISEFEFSPIYVAMSNKLPEVEAINALDELKNLSTSLSEFQEAGTQLVSGATELEAGQATYFENFSVATKGLQAYLISIDELTSKLKSSSGPVDLLVKGARSLNEGLVKWENSAKPLVSGFIKFSEGSKAFADGAKTLLDKVGMLSDALSKLSANANLLSSSSNQLTKGTSDINTQMNQLSGGSDQMVAAMKQFQKSLDPNSANYASYEIILKQMESMNASTKALSEGMRSLSEKSVAFNSGLSEFAQKTSELNEAPKLIAEGAAQLGTASTTLVESAAKLQAGTEQLTTGMSALTSGSETLANGLGQYKDGISQLHSKLPVLESATSKLGIGFKALDDNSVKLTDGSKKLKEGIVTFNEKGIKTMVDKLSIESDKIDVAVEIKGALEQLSNKYNSFTGSNEDMDATVNYVLKITETMK